MEVTILPVLPHEPEFSLHITPDSLGCPHRTNIPPAQVLADASGPGGAAAGPVPRIAGPGDAALEASVKQHGCTFRLNFAEVPRPGPPPRSPASCRTDGRLGQRAGRLFGPPARARAREGGRVRVLLVWRRASEGDAR